jgi:hypothetical protein
MFYDRKQLILMRKSLMKKLNLFLTASLLITFLLIENAYAQQIADTTFNPIIENPAYKGNQGPVIFIDEAHNNFHTMSGRYQGFAKLLQTDGYQLTPFKEKFTKAGLEKGEILVISNALHERNIEDWSLPTPAAFTEAEIKAVNQWVKNGGSLFLIADHMPFPGAAADLAASFGFKFYNGFALDTTKQGGVDMFYRGKGTLKANAITNGRNKNERIDSVGTFTGSGFEIPNNAQSILVFNSNFKMLVPQEAWTFTDETSRFPLEGFSQIACLKYGTGRIVVSGEAAMFTSQRAGNGRLVGMGSPEVPQNQQLLLNIIHWLDGLIE